jgi:4'-phosphopantetheinyl transferase EntD
MIETILPPSVASAAAYEDDDATLFPDEEALVARAVEARRRSFATARACARRALGELGLPAVAILRGERGEPRWPPGVVGSITHCAGYRASAVAWRRDVASLGIDAEPHEGLRRGLLGRIARAEEEDRLRGLAADDPSVHWDRLLFSAKESVYKAWFPLAGRWLGFHDAAVTIDPAGTLEVSLLVDGPLVGGRPLAELEGRWLVRDGLVATAIVVPADRGSILT